MPESSEPETAAERAQRWAAEAAETKPRSGLYLFVEEHLVRFLGIVVVLTMLSVVGYVAWNVAHRMDPGGNKNAGYITAATCFDDHPDDYFVAPDGSSGPVGALPTVDCEDAHVAEGFLSFDPRSTRSGSLSTCSEEWEVQSDVPLEQSGIELTMIYVSDENAPANLAVCVAVGPEPVEGRRLPTWSPSEVEG